ncbi:MAG: caspase family protein [Acidobacteriota bacterium]
MTLCCLLWPATPLGAKKRPPKAKTAEDLQIVDCLLPGQVKRLGRRSTFMAPRRPAKTTAIDCRIRGGEYVAYDRANYATALGVWLPAAKAGDPEAQTYVGEIFEKGLADTPDPGAAAEWYRKAAEQDYSRAQINLGHLYERGLGVPQDKRQALEWYRRAAGLAQATVLIDRQEAERLRHQVSEAGRELEAARSALEASRRAMKDLEGQLEAARSRAADEATRRLSAEIASRGQEVERRAESVTELESLVDRYSAQLADIASQQAALDDGAAASGTPSIEIVRPDILATRGPSLIPIAGEADAVEIVGRVTSPAGLRKLTVNQTTHTTDARGFFRVEAPGAERTEIEIRAIDLRGQEAQLSLILMPHASGQGPSPPAMPDGNLELPPGLDTGRYHALIISIANYKSLPALKTAGHDAEQIESLLAAKYGFETTLLRDPTYFEILLRLDSLRRNLGPRDNLLIYYAGHGTLNDEQLGFWLPADADLEDPSHWIPNDLISDYLSTIEAKHILVVSDSCYSGTLTQSSLTRLPSDLSSPDQQQQIRTLLDGKSRTVLTSGGLQPVLDEGGGAHSVFAKAFLSVLSLNRGVLLGTRLHQAVAARVSYAADALGLEQTPDYAPVRHAGHEAGDFFLVTGQGAATASDPAGP